jgi:hypothetical protein
MHVHVQTKSVELIREVVHVWEPDAIFDEGCLAHDGDGFQREQTRHDLASSATILHSPTIVEINVIIANILWRSKSVGIWLIMMCKMILTSRPYSFMYCAV